MTDASQNKKGRFVCIVCRRDVALNCVPGTVIQACVSAVATVGLLGVICHIQMSWMLVKHTGNLAAAQTQIIKIVGWGI